MIRVLISAEVRLYRDGLAEILAGESDIEVVGSAGGLGDTLAALQEFEPDVILLDPGGKDGLEVIHELANAEFGTTVIVLAASNEESELIAYAEMGVSGFVNHEDSAVDLIETVRSVACGELRCSPRAAGALLRRVAMLAAERSPAASSSRLTERELEVLELIEEGLSNKEIGARLYIEVPTVKHHVHHILEKLEVSRRSEAVACARRGGLLGRARPETSLV